MTTSTRSLIVLIALLGAGLVAVPTAAGAEPQLTVTPDRTIVDGETITLRGRAFPPGETAAAAQCRTEVLDDLDVLSHCDITNIAIGAVRAGGAIRLELKARRFIKIAGEPVDCAVPGTCVTGITSNADPLSTEGATTTAVELVFDDTVANDPPLELDVALERVTSRRLFATVTCNRPAELRLEGRLVQARPRGDAVVTGDRLVRCDAATPTSVLIVPRDLVRGPTIRFPRLLPGDTKLRLLVLGRAGRWGDEVDVRRTVDIVEPRLTRRAAQPHNRIEVDIRGMRITRAGRAIVRVDAFCPEPEADFGVTVTLLADGPGGSHRKMIGGTHNQRCDGAEILDVAVDRGDRFSSREEVLPAGRIEAYARGLTFPIAEPYGPMAMRPFRTERPILPESILVMPDPNSRLRIGQATSTGVRASMRCARTVAFTVFGTIGQPQGTVIDVASGRTLIRCVRDRTVTFDLRWDREMREDTRSAIDLRAINGDWFSYDGPWQQRQGAWRITG